MQMANPQLSVRLALLLATVCVVFLLFGGSADAESTTTPPIEYVVASGDTLWGIASAVAPPGSDVRRFIADIGRLSGIEGSVIHPGQVLLIPSG